MNLSSFALFEGIFGDHQERRGCVLLPLLSGRIYRQAEDVALTIELVTVDNEGPTCNSVVLLCQFSSVAQHRLSLRLHIFCEFVEYRGIAIVVHAVAENEVYVVFESSKALILRIGDFPLHCCKSHRRGDDFRI